MARKDIKTPCNLSFDTDTESDLIAIVQSLSSSHKLGRFVSSCVRLALESPEQLDSRDKVDIIAETERLGMTLPRYKKLTELERKTILLEDKVNKMYDMCLHMYTLSKAGKVIGLPEKTENMLLAQFAVEKFIEELHANVGINTSASLESLKMTKLKEKSESLLAYIIESYAPIVSELQANSSTKEVEAKLEELRTERKALEEEKAKLQSLLVKTLEAQTSLAEQLAKNPATFVVAKAPSNIEDIKGDEDDDEVIDLSTPASKQNSSAISPAIANAQAKADEDDGGLNFEDTADFSAIGNFIGAGDL